MENHVLQRAMKCLAINHNSGYLQQIFIEILDFVNSAKGFAIQMFCLVNWTVFPDRIKLLPSFSKLILPTINEKCYRN